MNSTELIKGTLTTIILKLLADEGKMYGYEITQRVKEISDGKILIKEGSLYPALHKLLDDGLVDVEKVYLGKRVRKYYKLTPQGQVQKEVQFAELQEFLKTIQHIVFPQFNTWVS
ncbi:PadR family transcriptional regulator [Catalinimonas niigatensis]|uniref:PadR family transcriptional regulator n=1 Tax=Catalinimonas niigatensis TaxID=1397264 RepID=UPI0026667EDC|nr:helix-turn-helix transcriptional regulator [Catalinimonas niigatensis]WPP49995.1 helix-turn-helix transcriptional regulator [Catalinimonas niigatensis]